jgi:ABC-type Zn2+ transport system, periplasmic component/surface adhesin
MEKENEHKQKHDHDHGHEHNHEHEHDHGHGGEHHHDHDHDFVTITVDGHPYKIHRGNHTVTEIKEVGKVLPADELNQIIDGKIVPLPNDGSVVIKGDEVFVSNRPSGGSSWS